MNIKRILLAILSIAYLVSATELHELLRVPQFVAHYMDHHAEDPSMDLGDYLDLHYSSTHPNDQDDEEDTQLPFKDTQDHHVDLTDIPFHAETTAIKPGPSTDSPWNTGRPLPRSYSIFRPPQLV